MAVEVVESADNDLKFTNSIITVEADVEVTETRIFTADDFKIADDDDSVVTIVHKDDTNISTS